MDLDYKFGDLRERFKSKISQFAETKDVPEDYYWHNSIYEGPKFRMGHVEHYTGNPVEVLHVVIVPRSDAPIFGFDLVSIAGNTTLACGDLSPTLREESWQCPFENNRKVPDWADFFSDDVLFTTPEKDGIEIGEWFADRAEEYIRNLKETDATEEVLRAQNEYMKNQRSNTKTLKSLAADVGEEKAKRYMHEIMFPVKEI
jgi:hypothetical protein